MAQHGLWASQVLLFSCSVLSNSLWTHGLQYTRVPCPSPIPGACSKSCPLSQWCHPTISSSVIPFSSCLSSFPASVSFSVSQLFTSGGQSIGASASDPPSGTMVKNPPANEKDAGSIPAFPGERNGNHSCLGNPMNQGAWWATVSGVAKSQLQPTTHAHSIIYVGEGSMCTRNGIFCCCWVKCSTDVYLV